MNYKFTTDWTHTNFIEKYDGPTNRCLEIGAFEGRTTITLANKFDVVDVIDPWKDYWDIPDASEAYNRFKHNTQEFDNINIYREKSEDVLPLLLLSFPIGGLYDLIYIDGNHTAEAVYNDIEMSCKLLTEDGVIIIDDYKTKTLPDVRLGIVRWLRENNNQDKIHFQSDKVQCCFKFKKDIY